MGIFNIGIAKGLAYRHDFSNLYKNLQYLDTVSREKSKRNEKRAKEIRSMINLHDFSNDFDRKKVQKYLDKTFSKAGDFYTENKESYWYDPGKQAELQNILNGTIDNEAVRRDKRVKANYDKFKENLDELTTQEQEEYYKKFENYNKYGNEDGDIRDKDNNPVIKEFTFTIPDDFNINEVVKEYAPDKTLQPEYIDTQAGQNIFAEKVDPTAILSNSYAFYNDYTDQIDKRYNSFSEDEKELYSGNKNDPFSNTNDDYERKINWIHSLIKANSEDTYEMTSEKQTNYARNNYWRYRLNKQNQEDIPVNYYGKTMNDLDKNGKTQSYGAPATVPKNGSNQATDKSYIESNDGTRIQMSYPRLIVREPTEDRSYPVKRNKDSFAYTQLNSIHSINDGFDIALKKLAKDELRIEKERKNLNVNDYSNSQEYVKDIDKKDYQLEEIQGKQEILNVLKEKEILGGMDKPIAPKTGENKKEFETRKNRYNVYIKERERFLDYLKETFGAFLYSKEDEKDRIIFPTWCKMKKNTKSNNVRNSYNIRTEKGIGDTEYYEDQSGYRTTGTTKIKSNTGNESNSNNKPSFQ